MSGCQLSARRRKIQAGALGILLIAGAALLTAYGWSSAQLRQIQLSNAEISTVNLTHALADQASAAFKTADTVLVGMVKRIEHEGLTVSDKDALRQLMLAHLAELPGLQGLFVYDAAGTWIVNSAGLSFNGRNNADREYFVYHRGSPDRGVHIGPPIIGRTSGAWVIPVSRRLQHADGRFAGVVLATIKIDSFRKVYEQIQLRRDETLILALENGTQLLSVPFRQAEIGADLRTAFPFSALAGTRANAGPVNASGPGHALIYGIQQVGDYPVLLALARSKEQVLAPWRESALAAGTALFALVSCLGALGTYLMRQMRLSGGLERDLIETKTALERSNASLLAQSRVDPLTGLFNRRYVESALEREIARARHQGTTLAALMIDVDHFKQYNDSHGHLAGDATLVEVAQTIRRGAVWPRAVAGRFGGEEFIVLLPATDMAGAARVAETIRADLEARGLAHHAAPGGKVSLSIGVSCIAPTGAADARDTLLNRADSALYGAKASGRNRVACDDGQERAAPAPGAERKTSCAG